MNSTPTWSAQLQPRYVSSFRCIGADCEDTCCYGWRVDIDKETHDKYQRCSDPEIRSSFKELITINTMSSRKDDYASLTLAESGCAFLSERLCSIQTKLGESYLPPTCATYPRYFNVVGNALEVTLDLSCPEAARLALASFSQMDLVETAIASHIPIPAVLDPHPAFHDVRSFITSLLRNRKLPLWQRLTTLGYFCDDIDHGHLPTGLIAQYEKAIEANLFHEMLSGLPPQPAAQLGNVLELIISRIGSEFTSRRFLDCYQEFINGIQWTMQSTMEDIGQRYAKAYSQHYAGIIADNEHVLENYLINYVWKNLFPFGSKAVAQKLGLEHVKNPAFTQYKLLLVHYAIVRTVSIGLAGFHKTSFDVKLLQRVIQSCTKTFEHSLTHPGRILEILDSKGIENAAGLATVIQDL